MSSPQLWTQPLRYKNSDESKQICFMVQYVLRFVASPEHKHNCSKKRRNSATWRGTRLTLFKAVLWKCQGMLLTGEVSWRWQQGITLVIHKPEWCIWLKLYTSHDLLCTPCLFSNTAQASFLVTCWILAIKISTSTQAGKCFESSRENSCFFRSDDSEH